MRPSVRLLAGGAAATILLGCGPPPGPPPTAVSPTPDAVAPAAPPVAATMPWPNAGDCRALAAAIGAVPAAERARLRPAGAPLAIAARDGPVPLSPAAAVTPDLPLPIDDGTARCLVVVERGASARAAPRRSLAHEMVRSTYRAGGAGRANPEHRRLRRGLRRLEAPDDIDVVATGDPGVDLIGLIAGSVLQGIGAALDGQAAAATRARLAATPPTLTEPIWEPYAFEVTTIEAARTGTMRARLIDRATSSAWALEERVVERRQFRVASGRRSRDRGLLEGGGNDLVALADIAVWEQAGLRPSLAGLVGAGGEAELQHRRSRSCRPAPTTACARQRSRHGRGAGRGRRHPPLPPARCGCRSRHSRTVSACQASAAQPRSRAAPPTGVTRPRPRGAPSASA